jgi:hypothetical protein
MVGRKQTSFGEVVLLFICQEHSVFHSYRFNECSLFLKLRLAFIFCLDFVQILLYLYIKVYFDLWSMLVFLKNSCFKKSSNGVGKEKKLYAKKWYKKELV